MADGHDGKDIFRQFSESTVEQVANVAQLAAEARRLGLIPEFPRELIEKLDVGGTLLDLFRLQLKHTTALASILGPQARNLEKLNHLSALISTGKSSAPRVIECIWENERRVRFELSVDNPIDRTQKLSVSLNKIHCLDDGRVRELVPAAEWKKEEGDSRIPWTLCPHIDEVEPHALRSCWIEFDVGDWFTPGWRYETTAILRLSPLGSLQRYQLRLQKQKDEKPR